MLKTYTLLFLFFLLPLSLLAQSPAELLSIARANNPSLKALVVVLAERVGGRELELFFQINAAWYQLFLLNASQEAMGENLKLLQSWKSVAEGKVEAGKASLADVLGLELQINALRQKITILETQKKVPLSLINQILHRSLDRSVELPTELNFAELSFDKDSLLSQIQHHHPRLRTITLQQEAAQQAILLNERLGKPQLGVGMDYIQLGNRTDAAPANNGRDVVQLKATLSIPLNRDKYSTKNREEMLRIEALDHEKEALWKQFQSEIEQAFAQHEGAVLKRDLYTTQVQTVCLALQILEAVYASLGSSFEELLRLHADLIDYELKMLEAVVDSHLARARLESLILR